LDGRHPAIQYEGTTPGTFDSAAGRSRRARAADSCHRNGGCGLDRGGPDCGGAERKSFLTTPGEAAQVVL